MKYFLLALFSLIQIQAFAKDFPAVGNNIFGDKDSLGHSQIAIITGVEVDLDYFQMTERLGIREMIKAQIKYNSFPGSPTRSRLGTNYEFTFPAQIYLQDGQIKTRNELTAKYPQLDANRSFATLNVDVSYDSIAQMKSGKFLFEGRVILEKIDMGGEGLITPERGVQYFKDTYAETNGRNPKNMGRIEQIDFRGYNKETNTLEDFLDQAGSFVRFVYPNE